jgi:uncharacterized protein YbjT (DUF2867 family)
MVTLVLLGIAMLTEIRDARRVHEATEPRIVSFTEALEELAVATGRTIRYIRISTEGCAALVAGQDVPEEVVVRLRRVVTELLDGRHARQTPGVERATGREPHDFGAHARPGASREASDAEPGRAASRSLSG